MNKTGILTAKLLTYSGLIPFLCLGMAVVIHVQGFDYRLALYAYSAVIISFLSGIHWAAFLFFSENCSRNLFMYSNVIALLGWLSVFPLTPYLNFGIQIMSFVGLLILDWGLFRNNIIPKWFFQLRRNATIIVVLQLMFTASFSRIINQGFW